MNPQANDIGLRTRALHIAMAQGHTIYGDTPSPPRLTVSDIERLAKAGVSMSFEAIVGCIEPDPKPKDIFDDSHLTGVIIQRWRMTQQPGKDFGYMPFHLAAAVYKGKVHVFVSGRDREPTVLVDEAHLFPSDALMANLHLYLEFNKGEDNGDMSRDGPLAARTRWR